MKNQPSRPYTVNELRQLIGNEDQEDYSCEKNKMGKCLVDHNLRESSISFYTITDYSELNYLFVSPKIEQITGHPVERFERGGLEFMLSLVHPEELNSIRLIHQKIVSFFQSLSKEEKLAYCYCYDVNVRMANGEYVRLLCEFECEQLLENGHLFIGRELFTEITQFDNNSLPILVIRHKDKTPEIPEIVFHFDNHKHNLSKREKEVYARMKEGKTSKVIADELHISIHTVDTHRRRINKKRK